MVKRALHDYALGFRWRNLVQLYKKSMLFVWILLFNFLNTVNSLLDESTSALDEETEARMLHNISAMRDKTCLIVTHRKAALSICDYRLHIVEGRMTKEAAELVDQEDTCIITESQD